MKMTIPEHRREEFQYLKEKAYCFAVWAMYIVANIYYVPNVYDEALRYYEIAASQGKLFALAMQAKFYFYGIGVGRDVNKGLQCYEQAADGGSLIAIRDLADIFLNGFHGVTRDLDKVRKYYEKGAATGHTYAQYKLALFYQGRNYDHNKIPGAKVNEAKAFEWFQKSAEQNYKDSMYELGRCYRDGKGTRSDPVQAKEWFVKAFAKGNKRSLFVLAIMVVEKALTTAEKQVIENLIEVAKFFGMGDVHDEWFQWYSNTRRGKTTGQERNDNTLLLDDLGLADATFLLARLLASTLDQDNLRIANKLISNVEDQLDTHELLARLSVLVEDLCKENEELSSVQQSRERRFDMQQQVTPIALIGQGQFGKVYLAWFSDRRGTVDDSRYVAVKFVDIDLANKDHVLVRNVVREQFACRTLKEKNVKNTVQYLGYSDLMEHRRRGLVFELCADLTRVKEDAEEARKRISFGDPIQLERLPNWIRKVPSSLRSCVVFCKNSKWTTLQVITMLRKAAEAVRAVHKTGFIHRDIAPRNILCDADGNVKLADFGWAKFEGSSYDDTGQLRYYGKACFTHKHQYALTWWAPECFRSEGEDQNALFSFKSDVYAFGITMWQCFSGNDPFSHVKDPEKIKKMILDGERPCLKKKPEKGGELDGNTPDDLIELIKQCWEQMADDRPKLKKVITELEKIEKNLQNSNVDSSRNKGDNGDPSKSWIGRMYRFLTRRGKNSVKETPYDVFLVHAGEHKMNTVSTMKDYFEKGGLKCFLDCEMTPGSNPTSSMRFALTTCRYAVVVLSHEFFSKRHPTSELMYAFQRMQWIRQQTHLNGWNSLIVVLYNMTVQDYKDGQRADGIKLPESLCSEVVLVEWSDCGTIPWHTRCSELCDLMSEQDKEKNVQGKWKQFRKQHKRQTLPSDFPSAEALYADDGTMVEIYMKIAILMVLIGIVLVYCISGCNFPGSTAFKHCQPTPPPQKNSIIRMMGLWLKLIRR